MLGKDLKELLHYWWFTFLVYLYVKRIFYKKYGLKIVKKIQKITNGSFELQLYILKETEFTRYLNGWVREKILSKKSFFELKNLYCDSVGNKKLQQLLLWFFPFVNDRFYTKIWVFNEADDANIRVWEMVGKDLVKWTNTKEKVSFLVEEIKEIDSSEFIRSNPESLEPDEFWKWMEFYIYKFDCSRKLNYLVKKGLETLGPETH